MHQVHGHPPALCQETGARSKSRSWGSGANLPCSAAVPMAPSSADTPYHSVVIVGAGVAGLNAARQLLAAFPDLLVLEAADRIGGRIKQVHIARCLHPTRDCSWSFFRLEAFLQGR